MQTLIKYKQTHAYSLLFICITIIKSDFWGWGLSVWPPMLIHPLRTEGWEVLLGIRLLGTTFWCGLSNCQAAAAQMGI